MKCHHIVFGICCTLACTGFLRAGEVPWTPDTPYNYDRRRSATEEDPSPWASARESSRVEYRLIYLMEADHSAQKLRETARAKLTEKEGILLSSVLDDLDETLEVSYRDAIPCFKANPNPTLLLMMLYHYNAYVNSAMERWEPTIKTLREFDPAITQKAEKLAAMTKADKSK